MLSINQILKSEEKESTCFSWWSINDNERDEAAEAAIEKYQESEDS